jgi:formylglycine-generating enzyme required for sulfatase activity
MALIPAGTFTMGDDEESPRREIYVSSFYLDRYEVTTSRYAKFLEATGSVRPPDEWEELDLSRGGDLPVIGVDWHDAQAYCKWAGKRLPTEAEWEKAARGTDGRRYPWGNASPMPDQANFHNASPQAYTGGLAPVGTHAPGKSPFGIHDLAGNAAEWVADWYAESFAHSDVRDPKGPESGTGRVIRGGGRFDPPERISATKRFFASPDNRAEDIGFRCASDL